MTKPLPKPVKPLKYYERYLSPYGRMLSEPAKILLLQIVRRRMKSES